MRTLALHVITLALADLTNERLSPDRREDAYRFFDDNTGDLRFWTTVADLNPAAVREAAQRRWERRMAFGAIPMPEACPAGELNGELQADDCDAL